MAKRNSRVLLVNSNRMQPPVAPIGLDYLASVLEEQGFEVELLDVCFAKDAASAIDSALSAGEPLAIGISLRN
ncbi:MAG: cobalamin-dependent protein, partial [Chloroflexota bacterium]|nr:cobalamin-dependent protein [Chloroflexota bacterium]